MTVSAPQDPKIVTYCHCQDCRRWTGAAAPVFAAFDDVDLSGDVVKRTFESGAKRWMCAACGSPMAAQFPYLPGQTYIPIGVLDQADDMTPTLHCHADHALPWALHEDGLDRASSSGRDTLNRA